MASRRQFLGISAAAAAVIAGGGALWQLGKEDHVELLATEAFDYHFLTLDDRHLLYALVPVYLAGALAGQTAARDRQILVVLHNVDAAIRYLSPAVRSELRDLFDVLTHQLGRALLAGVPDAWTRAEAVRVEAFLARWRSSFLSLQRAGYLGLHQLIHGAWYSEAASWPAIDYPGPPRLGRPGESGA